MIKPAIVSVCRLLSALLVNKTLVLMYGSVGLLAYGNFINFAQLMILLCTLGAITSSITLTAKSNDKEKYVPFSILSLLHLVIIIVLLLVCYVLFHLNINTIAFSDSTHYSLWKFSILTVLFSYKTLLLI